MPNLWNAKVAEYFNKWNLKWPALSDKYMLKPKRPIFSNGRFHTYRYI